MRALQEVQSFELDSRIEDFLSMFKDLTNYVQNSGYCKDAGKSSHSGLGV